MQVSEHYVGRKDGRVYYAKVGEGEPLLMLHAAGLSGWSWRLVIDKFAKYFTCYNVDLPGYDHSDIPPHQYEVEDYLDAIIDVMDSAGITKTSIVASHTGAMLAVVLAAAHPQRVKQMVLDGVPYWSKEGGRTYFQQQVSLGFTDTSSYDRPVLPLTTWEEASANNPNLTPERWAKGEEIKRVSRYWLRLTLESICNYDMTAIGFKVKAPSLILHGDGEWLPFGYEEVEQGIANTLVKVIQGSPGPVHEFKPQVFTEIALNYLSRHQ